MLKDYSKQTIENPSRKTQTVLYNWCNDKINDISKVGISKFGEMGEVLTHISGIMGMSFEILDIVINCLKENSLGIGPKVGDGQPSKLEQNKSRLIQNKK